MAYAQISTYISHCFGLLPNLLYLRDPTSMASEVKESRKRPAAEPECLKATAEFHGTFCCPVLPSPVIPDAKRCKLRINLIQEELNELKDAIASNDLVEAADALADIQYVLSGTIHEFGMGGCFKTLFDEVHRSNMSKASLTVEEAEKTIEHYKNKDGTKAFYKEVNGKFNVYREGDNKTLKSVNYSPADLKSIVDKQVQAADTSEVADSTKSTKSTKAQAGND